MEKKIKYFTNPVKSVENDDRVLRFIGSTEAVDRDDEVIKASGWKLKQYKTNPVVLINHQYHELPVAKTKKVWVDKENKALMFDIEFPEGSVSSQGDTLYKLYKGGFMNATSVGFRPNPEKMKFAEKKGEPRVTFNEQELLEISLVSVPANPEALLTSKSIKKAIKNEVIDELELTDLSILMQALAKPKDDEDEKILDNEIKDEKTSKKEKEKLISKDVHETDIKDISINKNEETTCLDCGKKLKCLCVSCKDARESEQIWKNLYQSLIDS